MLNENEHNFLHLIESIMDNKIALLVILLQQKPITYLEATEGIA